MRLNILHHKYMCSYIVPSYNMTVLLLFCRHIVIHFDFVTYCIIQNYYVCSHDEYRRRQVLAKSQPSDSQSQLQPKLFDFMKGNSAQPKYEPTDPKNKRLSQKVLECIIGCNLPLSLVEHTDFRALLDALNPQFSPPR